MRKILLTLALTALTSVSYATQIKLTKTNTLSLNDQVDSSSVAQLMEEARKIDTEEKSDDPIYLFLNTPGGSIQDGLELIESLKSLNRPVHTITLFAASMGFQIAQNMQSRYILANGVLMSHSAKGAVFGEFGNGFAQLDSRLSLWVQRILDLDNITVARTNGKQTLESYRKAYQPELWLTGAAAVAGGYADEVVTARCDTNMTGFKYQTLTFMGLVLKLQFSECPLNVNLLGVEVEIPTNKGVMSLNEFQQKGGIIGYVDGFGSDTNRTDVVYTKETFSLQEINDKVASIKKNYQQANRRPIGYIF